MADRCFEHRARSCTKCAVTWEAIKEERPPRPISAICINGMCRLCQNNRCEHTCHEGAEIIAFPI